MRKNAMRVLIADDHAVVRRGLTQLLAEEYPALSVGEARDASEVLQLARAQDWDIIILDISMPGRSGLEVLKELRQARPKVPVLVLTSHPEEQYALRVLKAGAGGYMTKEGAPEHLIEAVRRVAAGGRYIGPKLAELLAANVGVDAERPPHESLSDREYLVLCLIGSGKTVGEIAAELSLSVKTVSTYRARLLEKMGMKTNAELMIYAIKNGLVG
ncbi:MAG TPA: response regulator transcription factor [Pyrinomonadaceae bacterium]|nr:response regulator transcription factor [Pyrinomonadaceae bacterium]